MHSPEPLIKLIVVLYEGLKPSSGNNGLRSKKNSERSPNFGGGHAAFVPPSMSASRKSRMEMNLSRTEIASIVAGSAIIASAAFAGPAGATDVEQGAALFKANCSGCHLGGANFIKEKKTLQRDALEKYQSLDEVKLQEFVQTKMPHKMLPFHSEFSDDNYKEVISFVLDQAMGDKWN